MNQYTGEFPTLSFVDETRPEGEAAYAGSSSRSSSPSVLEEQFEVCESLQTNESLETVHKGHDGTPDKNIVNIKEPEVSCSVRSTQSQNLQPNGVSTLVESHHPSKAKVSVVSFRRLRSIDKHYTAVDILNHGDEESGDEDEDSGNYGHISTTWVTSFWTQFTVLLQRSFRQSKPEILSKINLFQVSYNYFYLSLCR